MIKGFNRRVVVMKNPDSNLFEEAYFIVKENALCNKRDKNPVEEAKKIVRQMEEENAYGKEKRTAQRVRSFIFLLIGIIVGILICIM